jgi:hypothetical protein
MSGERVRLNREQQAQSEQERYWQEMTARHQETLVRLIADLQRGRTQPKLLSPNASYLEYKIEGAREWFHRVRPRLPNDEYQQYIRFFVRVNREYLKRPPAHRQSFPLRPPMQPGDLKNPLCIKNMPILSEMKPHAGGRKPSHDVQQRNELIRECKSNGLSHYRTCKALDRARISPPAAWEGARWTFLYNSDLRIHGLIDRMFSKVALKNTKPSRARQENSA